MAESSISRRCLGAITVGQSPRPDLTPLFAAALPPGAELIERGVLDGLSRKEITRDYGPEPEGNVLISRLVDGSSVVISKARAEARVIELVRELEAEGCRLILLLCTGVFRGLDEGSAQVLQPQALLMPTIKALVMGRRAGFLVPTDRQVEVVPTKWACLSNAPDAPPPLAHALSPYDADDVEIAAAARALADAGAEILVGDCIGFVERHRKIAREASGLPVIVSTGLLSKLVAELV